MIAACLQDYKLRVWGKFLIAIVYYRPNRCLQIHNRGRKLSYVVVRDLMRIEASS